MNIATYMVCGLKKFKAWQIAKAFFTIIGIEIQQLWESNINNHRNLLYIETKNDKM